MSFQTKKNKVTKQNVSKKVKLILSKINEKDKEKICGEITYRPFEQTLSKIMKEKKLDIIDAEKQIITNIRKAVSPSKINPKNDYYSYINERWLEDIKLKQSQKYIVQVDDFRLVQDKVYRELLIIVEDYIKNNNSRLSTCIKKFYTSMKRLNTNEESSFYGKIILEQIDDLRKNKNNLWKLLGIVNSNEMVSFACPFSWSLNPDDKEPTIFRCYIDAPQLSLIDLNLYFNDGTDIEYKKKYLDEYFRYLHNLFEDVFGKNHGFNVKDVYDIEVKIIYAMGCLYKDDKKQSSYNKIYKDEALKTFQFNWDEVSKAMGFEKTPDFFITTNLSYLKCGTELLLKEWNSEQWRTYWIYIFIRQQQRWNERGRINYFNFEDKFVRGQEKMVDRYLFPIFGLGYAFNTFLTNEYIDHYADKKKIEYLKAMAEDLRQVFIRIIKRNKWLQPKTKEKALQKLYNFNFTIGSPKLLREDPLLDYSDIDCWGNFLMISVWRHNEAVKLEGHKVIDVPVIDWANTPPKFVGTQAYVVNASYTPSKNGIYVPLGYIQEPFIDLTDRGIEWNLAHLGFTLGHEMSHSLDDWGSQYDEHGKLHNWWTPEDKRKFKAIQQDVIKQYETFALYDGIKFDASIGIGEDLADISGLNICMEYLRDYQIKNKDILPIQSLSFEAFFVCFAYQMRQKLSKKAIAAQLKTNPHPLDKYRTNVPLSRLPVFRVVYDIDKHDKMYWPSTNRVWEN
jgi:putative endopeptidase